MPAVGERKVSIEKEGGKVLNSSEEIKKKVIPRLLLPIPIGPNICSVQIDLKMWCYQALVSNLSLFQCTSPLLQLLTLPHSQLKKGEEEFREC